LAELAPITQRRASNRFDLPQPFGPTIPVSPGSMRNSVGSTNDLNPERRSRRKCTALVSRTRRSPAEWIERRANVWFDQDTRTQYRLCGFAFRNSHRDLHHLQANF